MFATLNFTQQSFEQAIRKALRNLNKSKNGRDRNKAKVRDPERAKMRRKQVNDQQNTGNLNKKKTGREKEEKPENQNSHEGCVIL